MVQQYAADAVLRTSALKQGTAAASAAVAAVSSSETATGAGS